MKRVGLEFFSKKKMFQKIAKFSTKKPLKKEIKNNPK
jgi:hypothetical protein